MTHDQTEALTFADTVVVMHDGRVVQSGTPAELFDKPVHTFVGYFIGSPGMNIIPAQVGGHTARIDDLGRIRFARVRVGDAKLAARVPPGFSPSGDTAGLLFDAPHVHVYADSLLVEGAA